MRVAPFLAAAAAVLALAPATAALADDDPGTNRPYVTDPLEIGYDPLTSQDALITDAQESAVPPGPEGSGLTCKFNTPLTSVNPQPSQNSFVLMYVLPSDVKANDALDVPRYCSDGTAAYSGVAKASRNMASWLAAQGQGLNFRVQNATYTNWSTGGSFSTRAVRRFRATGTLAFWTSLAMQDAAGASPRLAELKRQLKAAGFAVPYSKYVALLEAPGQTSAKGSTLGVAELGGWYAFTTRYYPNNIVIRYGCATDGDKFLAHESTHELESPTAVNKGHVSDYGDDLMQAVMSVRTFSSAPHTVWDYAGDDYDTIVRASAYVVRSNLSGAYFTC